MLRPAAHMSMRLLMPCYPMGGHNACGWFSEDVDWLGTLLHLLSVELFSAWWCCLHWRLHLMFNCILQAAYPGEAWVEIFHSHELRV